MTAAAPRWSTGLCAGKGRPIILAWSARHVWNPTGCNQPYTWPVVYLLDLMTRTVLTSCTMMLTVELCALLEERERDMTTGVLSFAIYS